MLRAGDGGVSFARKMDDKKRKMIGCPLLAVGVLSTIPFAIHLFKNSKRVEEKNTDGRMRNFKAGMRNASRVTSKSKRKSPV